MGHRVEHEPPLLLSQSSNRCRGPRTSTKDSVRAVYAEANLLPDLHHGRGRNYQFAPRGLEVVCLSRYGFPAARPQSTNKVYRMSLPLIPSGILGYELYPGQDYFCVLNKNIRNAELNHPVIKSVAEQNSKSLDDYCSRNPDKFMKVEGGWMIV